MALGCAFAALSCGGSGTPEAEAPSELGAAESSEGRDHAESSDAEAEAEGSEEAGAAPSGESDPCADGSCFACGSGQCPAGFYCDESAAGGPGCSWLPECAPKSSCACLGRVLSGCSCSESNGGPRVTCGS